MNKTIIISISFLAFATSAFANDCVKITKNTPNYARGIVLGETIGCVSTHEVKALYDGNYAILKENTGEVTSSGSVPNFARGIIVSEK